MKKNVNDKQYNPTASFDAMTINGLKQLGITNCSTIMLYSIIQSFSKKTKYCNATNKYFSRFMGMTTRSIQKLLRELETKNLIKVMEFKKDGFTDERRIYPQPKMIIEAYANLRQSEPDIDDSEYVDDTLDFIFGEKYDTDDENYCQEDTISDTPHEKYMHQENSDFTPHEQLGYDEPNSSWGDEQQDALCSQFSYGGETYAQRYEKSKQKLSQLGNK